MFYWEPDHTPEEARSVGERVLDALAFARALLTLEDDYDVDWDLPAEFERRAAAGVGRPGWRVGRRPARRPGTVPALRQVCVSPLPSRPVDRRHEARAS